MLKRRGVDPDENEEPEDDDEDDGEDQWANGMCFR